MKAAFFDIDGVLTRGFIINDFWNHLGEKGFFPADFIKERQRVMKNYKKGKISYVYLVTHSVESIAKALKGKKRYYVKKEMKDFLHSRNLEIFPYAKPLIKLLKKQRFKIIAVSGSNHDFIENYKEILGFDEVHGTKLEVENDTYTGKVKINLALKETKASVIHTFNSIHSLGFGDTEQDAGILENVNIPIAVNPTKELRKIAVQKDWKILTEKNDVVKEVRKLL